MAGSIWSGSISFGLISIPIKLFTAVRHKGVSFNQLDDRNMSRIRYQKVSEADDEVVPAEHIVKGVEISKGRYVIVDPDELAPFVPLATKSVDVESSSTWARSTRSCSRPPTTSPPHLGGSRTRCWRGVGDTGKVAIARFVMRAAGTPPCFGRLTGG